MKTKIEMFNPIDSQNPIYLGAADEELYKQILLTHGGSTFAEIKEDGYRAQIHKKGEVIKAYTRSQNEIILPLYPELYTSLSNLPDCILDAELIGDFKIGHEGFKSVKSRFRHKASEEKISNYLNSGLVEKFPLALRVFDTLYWENTPLVDSPLSERRNYTENILEKKIIPSTKKTIYDSRELHNWFSELVNSNYEGLVCKNPNAPYRVGGRTEDWIKVKRSETLDLSVLGVYFEGDTLSQILCGNYNPLIDKFETLAKVNAKREGMNSDLLPLLEGNLQKEIPSNILINPSAFKLNKLPELFINPIKAPVVEVSAMNFNKSKNWHSCGLEDGLSYSLRIGWLKNIREDKDYRGVATTSQVIDLYNKGVEENDG